ncbi:hypothetical protein HZA38_03510 [Candidatus Peregrinibacteria bacterium]|nr:hypothetical protein [Candidatus Peregrinibacteria bacterium]
MPLRHGLFVLLSLLPIVGAFFLVSSIGIFTIPPVLLFVFAMICTVMTAILPTTKWLAAIWPVLFLLLGLSFHTDILMMGVYALTGAAFSLLFLQVKGKSKNYIQFPFLEATKPVFSTFLFVFVVLISAGIYAGVSSEKIKGTVSNYFDNLESIPFFGGNKLFAEGKLPDISGMISGAVEDARKEMLSGSFLDPLVAPLVEQKIQIECQNDPSCIKNADRTKVTAEIKSQFSGELEKSFEKTQEKENIEGKTDTPRVDLPDMKDIKAEAKNMAITQLSALETKVSLSLILGLLVFLTVAPFIPIFAWGIALLTFLFFLIFRATHLIQKGEEDVKKVVYI